MAALENRDRLLWVDQRHSNSAVRERLTCANFRILRRPLEPAAGGSDVQADPCGSNRSNRACMDPTPFASFLRHYIAGFPRPRSLIILPKTQTRIFHEEYSCVSPYDALSLPSFCSFPLRLSLPKHRKPCCSKS